MATSFNNAAASFPHHQVQPSLQQQHQHDQYRKYDQPFELSQSIIPPGGANGSFSQNTDMPMPPISCDNQHNKTFFFPPSTKSALTQMRVDERQPQFQTELTEPNSVYGDEDGETRHLFNQSNKKHLHHSDRTEKGLFINHQRSASVDVGSLQQLKTFSDISQIPPANASNKNMATGDNEAAMSRQPDTNINNYSQKPNYEQLLLTQEAEIQSLKRVLRAKQAEVRELGQLIQDLKRQADFKFQQMQQQMEQAQRESEFKLRRQELLGAAKKSQHAAAQMTEVKQVEFSGWQKLEAALALVDRLQNRVADLENALEVSEQTKLAQVEKRDIGVQIDFDRDLSSSGQGSGVIRKHARQYLHRAGKDVAPGQIAFLHEEHAQLANHLSHDNQKLLKIFEEKQMQIRCQSERIQAQQLALMEESRDFQEWKLSQRQKSSQVS